MLHDRFVPIAAIISLIRSGREGVIKPNWGGDSSLKKIMTRCKMVDILQRFQTTLQLFEVSLLLSILLFY